jgi:serine/threonine protein kinase
MDPCTPVLDEPAPHKLNKYRLLAPLARGGMAEVFLARADGIPGLDRLLVVKRILPALASDAEFVRMFLDEARIAATLHHPNIVRVFEVDIADGQVFYVMEHLHGHDVATLLRRLGERGARLPLDAAIAIAAAVATGLHHAHERRGPDGEPLHIVHRDVAPGNVIVTFDGEVKLIDFGIAKAAGNLHRTRFGLFKGKLPYASPEQCRCEPIDRRSDVFSLGVLLYELTTGERPFGADSEHELLRVVSDAVVVAPRSRDRAYPAELEAIVLKALAADPAQRHATAGAVQRELVALAGRLGLDRSATGLAQLMASAFGAELTQWHNAEHRGRTLEQHLTSLTSARTLEWQRPAAPAPRRWIAWIAAAAVGLVAAAALLAAALS